MICVPVPVASHTSHGWDLLVLRTSQAGKASWRLQRHEEGFGRSRVLGKRWESWRKYWGSGQSELWTCAGGQEGDIPGPVLLTQPHPPSFPALVLQALTYLRQAPKRRAGKHDCHYPEQVKGNFHNWRYGKTLFSTLHLADEHSLCDHRPGLYGHTRAHHDDNETAYLAGWHIHTPAERAIDTSRTRAELLLVHLDAWTPAARTARLWTSSRHPSSASTRRPIQIHRERRIRDQERPNGRPRAIGLAGV